MKEGRQGTRRGREVLTVKLAAGVLCIAQVRELDEGCKSTK